MRGLSDPSLPSQSSPQSAIPNPQSAIEAGFSEVWLVEGDLIGRMVHRAGQEIDLQPREFQLLEFLMRSAGRLCGRMMILEKVWDYDFDPGTNLVDVYVRRLREKIDTDFEPKLLHTVRGSGYVIRETP